MRKMIAVALLFIPCLVWGQAPAEPRARDSLNRFTAQREPRPPEIREITLEQARAELMKNTGNGVEDRRSRPTNPTLKLGKIDHFWKTLDEIGKQTGIGFSPYQPDGGVALVDRPYRELKTDYSGPFRFAVKRIAVSRDEETQAHLCQVTLEAAWEPRYAAIFVNLHGGTVTVAMKGKSEKLDPQSAQNVAGTSATELDLRMQAPPRQVARIDSLQGAIRVVGAPKVLEFKFADLKTGQAQVQENVKIRLSQAKMTGSRWAFEIETEHPAEAFAALDKLDSSQQHTWKQINRVWLTWYDPKTKRTYEIEPTGNGPEQGKGNVSKILYYFPVGDKMTAPPKGVEMSLHYRTPSRIEISTVPFSFQDLPLP